MILDKEEHRNAILTLIESVILKGSLSEVKPMVEQLETLKMSVTQAKVDKKGCSKKRN